MPVIKTRCCQHSSSRRSHTLRRIRSPKTKPQPPKAA